MGTEIVCQRLGKCCHYEYKGVLKKCKYLVYLKGGKTLCRVYRNRIGKKIGDGNVCTERTRVNKLYDGCPYNKVIIKWRQEYEQRNKENIAGKHNLPEDRREQ